RKVFQGLKTTRLGPLDREGAQDLALAHWPDAPPEAIAKIVEAGMGNPLFIREYAVYARKRKDVSSLPATVQNIFLTGLERYPAEWRDLAKRLSVFVHSFTAPDARYVQKAIGADEGAVDVALVRFLKDGLVVESAGSYSFRADVYKKALYASLLNHNKRVLHGLIADLLLARDRPDRIRLIYHLVRSERFAEAARVMQDDPNRTYNYELLPYIETLLRRIKDDHKARIRLLVTKAAILYNRGKIAESEAVLQRIMRGALARRDPNMLGYAYHQVCAYSAMTYAYQKAIFTGQKALYYYRKSDISVRSVQNVIRTIAQAHVCRGDLDEARRLVVQCETLPGGDVSDAYEARAEFQLMTGDYAKALETADRNLASLPPDRTASLFYAYDTKIRALWQLCDFRGIEEAAEKLLSLRPLSESVLSEANAMCALSNLLSGRKDSARDAFVQAEFYAGQIRNEFARVDALRTLALCRYLAGDVRKAESLALEALTLGLRHSCYWPTFTLLVMLAESSAERGKDERARFFLVEASYFFTTGVLLPSKDLILYYWLASRLLDGAASGRNQAVALRLFEEEKSRIGREDLVAEFLSTRSYARIQRALEGAPADDPRRLA
ncbi:MAG: hypothetical protein Q8M76_10820, partial [Spirochaetaceae bacterium]|nr:hypothetical protein [Spirochaetaceae bacterium]